MNKTVLLNSTKILIGIFLLAAITISWVIAADVVEAQSPDEEPTSPLVTPEPTAEPPAKVVITVEPLDPPPATSEPEPSAELEDPDVVVDPPTEAELGDPIQEKGWAAVDDREDREGEPIDIFDLTFVAARYGSGDSAADLNLDGTVDIFDLTILAAHYGQAEPEAGAVIVTPEPDLTASGASFGEFDLPVTYEGPEVESQYYVDYRPLRIGISLNYFRVYDATDTNSAPDAYASMSVGGVPVRTSTMYNAYQGWPYWRLGWWRYHTFPRSSYASLPINIELRDDDGYVCYGYYGCRYQWQHVDVSPPHYNYTKRLTLYPSQCRVVDEAGTTTYGAWLNSNRCRVYLQSWGSQWPRGYISYYLDAQWD